MPAVSPWISWAIADWGWRLLDKGLKYPIPTFPQYLFTPLPDMHQAGAQVPVKPSQLGNPGGDVRNRSRESWKWLVTVLQFWTDEASVADGIVYGGHVCPVSALAEYVLNTINLGLEPRSWVTWEDVVIRTPWMSKRLHSMTARQEQTIQRQALPMPGESSDLEVISEKLYTEYLKKTPSAGRGKIPLRRAGSLTLHLKKTAQGKGWTHAEPRDTGPEVGNPYRYPKETASWQEGGGTGQSRCSPLTNELLALGEELIGDLDYEDVKETEPAPDPEITKAVAHIPKADACADVEMQDIRPPLGFEPEVARCGYDVSLSAQTQLGWDQLPRSWRVRTGCWMKRVSPRSLGMAGQVLIKTPTVLLTTKFPGHYFPGKPMDTLEDRSFPQTSDRRLES